MPQNPVGATGGVAPIKTLKSKTLNESPRRNASVTVNMAPPAGAVNVHGGAPTNTEFAPELRKQSGPLGSAGKQPLANMPTPVKENSCQGPPIGTGTSRLGTASSCTPSTIPFPTSP